MINHEELTIQQVAEATGLSVHTLRYYERIGLIHSIERAENTHRRYTQGDIGWIAFLTKLRSTGMSIQQMQRYAELTREGDHTLADRVALLKAHRREVQAHMDEVLDHLKRISVKIDYYEARLEEHQTGPDGCLNPAPPQPELEHPRARSAN
jgi:DNA-binding transcriptional MerR regulator